MATNPDIGNPNGNTLVAAKVNPSPVLGKVLGYGARVSVALFVVGFVLSLIQGEHGGKGLNAGALRHSLEHGTGTGVVGLALAVLIATPVVREAVALVLFARAKERPFVVLAAIVLALVGLSVLIGSR
ncbi:MAG: hypothetical protein JWO42_2077 [Chloroflexi bacterium]|jgi:uncharacterized membrane protein|nr:hypothetical protein [Chloroflexota bacterium]